MGWDVESLFDRRADQRWNRMAVGNVLERLTWSMPDKPALVGAPGAFGSAEFRSVTYREGDAIANQVAHVLRAQGLQQGDRVLLYCDKSVEAVLSMIGIAKAGLVAVPVNPLLAPEVLTWGVGHTRPSSAVVDAEYAARATPVLTAAGLSEPVHVPIGGQVHGPAFADWIRDRAADEVEGPIHADDVWILVFTSGTTAMPKASMATHTYSCLATYTYALSLTRGLPYEQDLRLCTFLSITYHCGHNAAVFPAFFSGGTVVLGRWPDAARIAETVTAEAVTVLWARLPALLQRLVDQARNRPDEIDLHSLTVALFSWGATNPSLFDSLREVRGDDLCLVESSGQTESMSSYRFWPERTPCKRAEVLDGVNHVGAPNPMLAADIVDSEGRSLRGRPGVAGEAVYRSPVLTAGYYRDLEATAEAFRGGWFYSGDSCAYQPVCDQIMDDRFKDIVKTGGENISSLREESVLAEHPDVERVSVIGLPDEHWGEAVTAVVTLADGVALDEAALIAFARERLAGYEAPKRVIAVEQMPETVGERS